MQAPLIWVQVQTPETTPPGNQGFAQVIQEYGRPVIIVPPDFSGQAIGASVLLGWGETREALRDAHDLTSVARPGDDIFFLQAGSSSGNAPADFDGFELAWMYDLHGLRAETLHRDNSRDDIAKVLLTGASEKGVDLLAKLHSAVLARVENACSLNPHRQPVGGSAADPSNGAVTFGISDETAQHSVERRQVGIPVVRPIPRHLHA